MSEFHSEIHFRMDPREDFDALIRQMVSIDDSQFGSVPGRGTTVAIFVVPQLHEKYLAVNKRLYIWPSWTLRKHLIVSLGS